MTRLKVVGAVVLALLLLGSNRGDDSPKPVSAPITKTISAPTATIPRQLTTPLRICRTAVAGSTRIGRC